MATSGHQAPAFQVGVLFHNGAGNQHNFLGMNAVSRRHLDDWQSVVNRFHGHAGGEMLPVGTKGRADGAGKPVDGGQGAEKIRRING